MSGGGFAGEQNVYLVEVHRVLKGNLKPGLVMMGTHYWPCYYKQKPPCGTPPNRRLSFDYLGLISAKITTNRHIQFLYDHEDTSGKYVNPVKLEVIDSHPYDIFDRGQIYGDNAIHRLKNSKPKFDGITFSGVDSMYRYLFKTYQSLKLEDFNRGYKKPDSLEYKVPVKYVEPPTDFKPSAPTDPRKMDSLMRQMKNGAKNKKPIFGKSSKTSDNTFFVCTIQNVKLAGSGAGSDRFLQFDVFMKPSQSCYFDQLALHIRYAEECFGIRVDTLGNVSGELDTLFANNQYYADSLLIADHNVFNNVFAFILNRRSPTIPNTKRTWLEADQDYRIGTFKLRIQDCGTISNPTTLVLSQEPDSEIPGIAYSDEETGTPVYFAYDAYLDREDYIYRTLCYPVIMNISPNPATAGIEQVVTVSGYNFGPLKPNMFNKYYADSLVQKITLPEANSNGSSRIAINPFDYDLNGDTTFHWKDEEVQFKVPSIIYEMDTTNRSFITTESLVPGSGKMTLTNTWGLSNDTTNDAPFIIDKALINQFDINPNKGWAVKRLPLSLSQN
jgi:hypothetical protein